MMSPSIVDPEQPRLSAHNLEEYGKCQRKFALKYKARTFWPAATREDAGLEARAALGNAFHQLVQSHALGLDAQQTLEVLADDAGALADLWGRFLASPHAAPAASARVWTEQVLNFSAGGLPCFVRYDRLVQDGDRWTILDWKTGRVNPTRVRGDWQTRLYLYALVEAGAALGFAAAIAPEQVTLVYWEVATGTAVTIPYGAAAHAATGAQLAELAKAISRPFDPAAVEGDIFTRKKEHCEHCHFDSLCNRPPFVPAGPPDGIAEPRFIPAPDPVDAA